MQAQGPEQKEELRHLLEAADAARSALAELDEERQRLMMEIAGMDAAVLRLQQSLSAEERAVAYESYLQGQLERLDDEMAPAAAPVGNSLTAHAGNSTVTGAPGGIERRAAPRPAPIRLPDLAQPGPEISSASSTRDRFLKRARALLNRSSQRA